MAMVRSSMVETVRRALSVRNPQSLRRNYGVPASNPTSAPHEVDQLANKAEELAKKEVLLEHVESLVKEKKAEFSSPILEGARIPWFQAVAFITLFMAGYRVGLEESTEAGRKR